ncbi:hypothetical protein MNBD_NITROSPINAE03-1025 [hydrothermal vent metagenome]|uniref:HMA domain-containing protein n=1 Tax=hydrothermal vent metagenome TaxID=652676 RepID=A0A3B1CHZ6_9ZZZZ
MAEIIIQIEGMECGHCAKEVSEALSGINGARKIRISLEKAFARIVFDESVTGADQMIGALDAIGFKAVLSDS